MFCDNCGDEIDFFDVHEGPHCETLCCICFHEQEYLHDEVFGEEDKE